MFKRLNILLISLLTPGMGYLHNGNTGSFYKTVSCFYSVLVLSVISRSITNFWGFLVLLTVLPAIYLFTALHATLQAGSSYPARKRPGYLKLFFTVGFLLITGLSFANRRVLMGFDVMSMDVPVMQPALMQGDKFLVDTWAYFNNVPRRGDIVVHSFNGQQGLYLNRIIAIENDKLEIINGIIHLNGQRFIEPYVMPVNVTRPQSRNMKALIIPQGHYFVMGDNRDASFGDSRFSGTITGNNIIGRITDIINSKERSFKGVNSK